MPELPEVETVRRKLEPLTGRTVRSFWNNWPRGLKSKRDTQSISRDISGRKILRLRRHGKVLLIELGGRRSRSGDVERLLAFHLRMSGGLYMGLSQEKIPFKELKHIHTIVYFTDGRELRFHDPRKFGLVWYGTPKEVGGHRYFTEIGPDALNLNLREFKENMREHIGMVKPLLLRQDFVAGIGNIVADETLWGAKVHPRQRVEKLGDHQINAIYRSLINVLRRGIEAGGATLRDWKHPDNEEGKFQEYMKVYGRKGKPCPTCRTKIRRIVVGGRGTWICEKCQRL